MNNDLHFLKFELSSGLTHIGSDDDGEDGQSLATKLTPNPTARPTLIGTVPRQYEVAVKQVQKRFPYLDIDDIFYPPHGRYEAKLARQIALYILHHELAVPKRRLSEELERSRGRLKNAMESIDRRREETAFARAYDDMAKDTREAIRILREGE